MPADSELGPFPVRHVAQVEERPEEEVWLVERLWGRGAVGFTAAPPKTCKTWLGCELAVAVATGAPSGSCRPSGRLAVRVLERNHGQACVARNAGQSRISRREVGLERERGGDANAISQRNGSSGPVIVRRPQRRGKPRDAEPHWLDLEPGSHQQVDAIAHCI